MNPEKQRIAIAELDGWKRDGNRFTKNGLTAFSPPVLCELFLPYYPLDLNAMHNVVNTRLTTEERARWIHEMDCITADPDDKADQALFTVRFMAAGPGKWAEAFLRVKGKWEDE